MEEFVVVAFALVCVAVVDRRLPRRCWRGVGVGVLTAALDDDDDDDDDEVVGGGGGDVGTVRLHRTSEGGRGTTLAHDDEA